jgi:lyso-ornithine lipid O-acyltransferase
MSMADASPQNRTSTHAAQPASADVPTPADARPLQARDDAAKATVRGRSVEHGKSAPATRVRRVLPTADIDDAPRAGAASVWRKIRATRRLLGVLVWSIIGCTTQTILVRLRGPSKIWFARFFWRTTCRLIGLEIRIEGALAGTIRDRAAVARGERPVIFVANHSSWLDIPAIGSVLPTVFVAKDEVGRWPIMGTISRLGRTIFVSRQRNNTGRELSEMTNRLADGDNLILFPEGTSSDGGRVLPFLSSFFAIAKPGRLDARALQTTDAIPAVPPVVIQPVSVVYDRLEGLPVSRSRRSVFSWYGDMDLAPHVWKFCQWRNTRATVILHPPLYPDAFRTRKALANEAWRVISDGAADLRHR